MTVRKKRLAYVITITKDGYFGLDGAAVLAYSIINSTSEISRAEYEISFIAFVHPDVITTRPGLQRLGRTNIFKYENYCLTYYAFIIIYYIYS